MEPRDRAGDGRWGSAAAPPAVASPRPARHTQPGSPPPAAAPLSGSDESDRRRPPQRFQVSRRRRQGPGARSTRRISNTAASTSGSVWCGR